MIKAPCVVKYYEFQDDYGYVGKNWYIEDAVGATWADDACEADCRVIADALNDAARYRQALEDIRNKCVVSSHPHCRDAARIAKDALQPHESHVVSQEINAPKVPNPFSAQPHESGGKENQ